MSLYTVLSIVISLAAVFSYLNYRFIRLPTTIGVTLIALVMSVAIIGLDRLTVLPLHETAMRIVARLDFPSLVIEGMLSLLLFAGALNVNLDEVAGQKVSVALLASVGVLVSTALVGTMTWAVSLWLGLGIDLVQSLLFGALISPTDPIAVLGILRSVSAPKELEAQIAGEALFNDGVAVVLFSVLMSVAASEHGIGGLDAHKVVLIFVREIGGSLLLGLGVGWLTLLMLRTVDDYHVEVLITLALALGLYTLAIHLHTSGPLSVVVAGLLIGSRGRAEAMSKRTVHHLDMFWELVDEILNVVLFVLIGLELLVLPLSRGLIALGALAIVVVLVARALSVGATVLVLSRHQTFARHTVKILTWGGLRGGLSIAMALSLGADVGSRHTLQAATYVVALFSIAVQGLTFGPLIRATTRGARPADANTG